MLLKGRVTHRFDGFVLDPGERRLDLDGKPVPLSPKALDALLLLVEHGGRLVDKSTLRERLWPGQIVEEGNLTRVIADLRKALGQASGQRQYIETVTKFGYRFLANVVTVGPDVDSTPPVETPTSNPGAKPPAKTKWMIVAMLVVTLAGLASLLITTHRPSTQSLLVLPFRLIGNSPEAEIAQQGLEDCLTMELSGLSGLAVIDLGRQNASSVTDAAEIGRRRRTTFVLDGTIELDRDRIHLNVRLLRSATGEAIWVHSFDESRNEMSKVESRLARLTVAELFPTLSAAEGARLARRLPTNAAAHQFYVLGRHYWNKRDENDYIRAIDYFKQSAAADPEYAPAYVGLADSYLLATSRRQNLLTETLPLAKAAVDKAIEIDPSLGEAHATLAMIAGSYYFDWDKAEQELETAVRLSPNYPTAHHWYAEFLTMMGKFKQSEAEFEVTRGLDPASAIILTDLAQLYTFQRQYARSLQTLDEVLKLDSSFHLAHERKGYALLSMRQPIEALKEFEIADRQAERRGSTAIRAWGAAVAGKRPEAIALAQKAEQSEPDGLLLSVVWAELGETDRAMDWLERACRMRQSGLVSIKVNPIFDGLRSSARFQALLRQMHLN